MSQTCAPNWDIILLPSRGGGGSRSIRRAGAFGISLITKRFRFLKTLAKRDFVREQAASPIYQNAQIQLARKRLAARQERQRQSRK